MSPEIEQFLRELAELSRRHGFWINGCGECGSPWIQRADGERDDGGEYLQPTDEYDGYKLNVTGYPYGEHEVVRV